MRYIFAGKQLDRTKTLSENGYKKEDHGSIIVLKSVNSEREKNSLNNLNATMDYLKTLSKEELVMNGGIDDV